MNHLLNKQNTFQNPDRTWEIIELKVWDKIQQLQKKTDFIFKYIPEELKLGQNWEIAIIKGEERAIISQNLYKYIVENYIWARTQQIPPIHRYKGQGIEGEILVFRKEIFRTIYRRYQSRG